jgi:hypothetical protein
VFSFFGKVIFAGSVVRLGSALTIPVMILAVVWTVSSGLADYWGYLLAIFAYALVLNLLVKYAPTITAKGVVTGIGSLAPSVVYLAQSGFSFETVSLAAFLVAVFFGTSGTMFAEASRHMLGVPKYTDSYSPDHKVSSRLLDVGDAAGLAFVQLLWLAPATLVGPLFPSVFPILATLLGAIATFFVAEGAGF